MSSAKKHRSEYEKNVDFLHNGITSQDKYPNWTITVMFYCGVHLVEMLLADAKHCTVNDHAERYKLMQECLDCYEDIREDYAQLKKLSNTARYDCVQCSNRDMLNAQMCLDTIKKYSLTNN